MSDAKQNLPLPEGACSVTCPSCHLTIVHEKPRPLPPDAVSGAATPAQQCKCGHPKSKHLPEPWGAACMRNGGECQCAEYVERGATPEAQCKCKCVFCFEGHHHRCVRGCDWIPFPAATPEAQIPECVHAPGSRADRLFRYLINPCDHLLDKSHYGDLVMFSEAAAAIRVLEGKLEATRTESAALRVERDQAWNEAIAKAVEYLELTGEFADEVARGVIVDLSMVLRKVTGMVHSLARPIPAEKPDRETKP